MLSGLHAEISDQELVKTYLSNQAASGLEGTRELVESADRFLPERFRPAKFEVTVVPLSSVISEYGIRRIDLLKINAEKSELDILSGITADDYSRIRQIVLEVDRREDLTQFWRYYCVTDMTVYAAKNLC